MLYLHQCWIINRNLSIRSERISEQLITNDLWFVQPPFVINDRTIHYHDVAFVTSSQLDGVRLEANYTSSLTFRTGWWVGAMRTICDMLFVPLTLDFVKSVWLTSLSPWAVLHRFCDNAWWSSKWSAYYMCRWFIPVAVANRHSRDVYISKESGFSCTKD